MFKNMKSKKILVTGGFGFIGSTLVEILIKDKKNKVHVIDDMSTSPVDIKDYLETIGNPKNLSYEIITVEKFFQKKRIGHWNEIYHLASPVGPAGVLKYAGRMIQSVVRDGYLIIDYCLKNKTKLLDVSTSEVYGGGVGGYCPESTPRIVPANVTVRLEYAIAKMAIETAIVNICRVFKLNASIVRPFNVSGKRQSPKGGFVLPRFIQQAYENKPITVFGDGSDVRAFTNVKDVAIGIILAMEKGKNGEIYNIGNPANKINILHLAKKVKKVLKSKSEITSIDPKTIYGNYYEGASDKFPDANKAMKELGWKPQYDIDSTILEAYDEFIRQKEKGVLRDKI